MFENQFFITEGFRARVMPASASFRRKTVLRSSLAAGSAAPGRQDGELCRQQQGSRKEHCQLVPWEDEEGVAF